MRYNNRINNKHTEMYQLMMTAQNTFKQVDLFRGLEDTHLAEIQLLATQIIFKSGDTIFEQGDSADRLYIVAEGQVEVRYRTSGGEDVSVLFLGKGQVIGEMTLVDEGKRSATIIAITEDTIVYSIPNKTLEALCAENTAIGYVIMRNIAQDLSFKLRHRDFDIT